MPGPITRQDRAKMLGRLGNQDALLTALVDLAIAKRASLKFNETGPVAATLSGTPAPLTVSPYDVSDDVLSVYDSAAPLSVHVLVDSGPGAVLETMPVELEPALEDGVLSYKASVSVSGTGAGTVTLSLSGTESTAGLTLTDTIDVVFS